MVNPIVGSTVGQNVSSTYYVAGGGGGWGDVGGNGAGGNGGGGAGGPNGGTGTAGTVNTGGGGGGSGGYGGVGGAGGSGVVVIKYNGIQSATGGTVVSPGAYTIHTFTGDGTFTTNNFSRIIN
jgi:hypothetical protein